VADDAGALLVRSGLVTSSALDDARARVTEIGGTVGEQLVAGGVLTDDVLTDFYKTRLLVPQVNPNTLARLPIKVIGLIPNDMAIELRVVPVSIDEENNLTVAMSDPSDRHAVDEIAFFTGAYVVRAVATQMQIAWCLAHYYGHVTNLGQRLLRPEGEPAPEPVSRPHRQRGITGEVEAMRHRGLVPGEAHVEPDAKVIVDVDEPAPPAVNGVGDEDGADVDGEGASDGGMKVPRPRSVSGEIRVQPRAQSVKPPMPDDSGPVITMEADEAPDRPTPDDADDGEEITIEAGSEQSGPMVASYGEDEDTGRAKPAPPQRRRPADPDPPELAARGGEVEIKSGIDREIGSGPSIVIDESLDDSAVPAYVSPSKVSAMEHAREASGEISLATGLREVSGEIAMARTRSDIRVEADSDDSAPVMIHESLRPARIEDEPSAPILLDRKRPSDPPLTKPAEAAPEPVDGDDFVELPRKPTKSIYSAPPSGGAASPGKAGLAPAVVAKRAERRTSVGIGVVGTPRAKHDTVEAMPAQLEDDITGEHAKVAEAIDRAIDADPTRVDTFLVPDAEEVSSDQIAAPPAPLAHDDTSPIALPPRPGAASPVPPPSGRVELSNVKRAPSSHDEDDDAIPDVHHGKPTMVMPSIALSDDNDDAEWGAPGTTIPPPFLGSIPGIDGPRSGIIPLPDIDSQPLMVAPPSPPEHIRAHSTTEAGVARALEQATMRVLTLIRDLEHAENRDEVVAVMIAHLAETHRRAGFFAVRSNELSLFSITPNVVPLPWQTIKLDRPSTLGDVVGTRLPYRGPMHDQISRNYLEAILGVCPPEILLVPITVRERVVGVLFGEHRMRHTFDDQLALASRAAGDALERILRAKRG
jgi:hypothetical protein